MAEAIIERVLGARDVGVDPGKIRQLFEREGRDGAFIAFADSLEGEVVAVGV